METIVRILFLRCQSFSGVLKKERISVVGGGRNSGERYSREKCPWHWDDVSPSLQSLTRLLPPGNRFVGTPRSLFL
ncbi:hypothetical protein LEP1GSC163_2549 [Leptospira santarosai str. CBC379]|uniref:Uncharacterized protein n=1 Tax=Leptospira santarosai str. MOR084 TaxID=1049984 RepID=A0A0E2BDK7_9LEPT|nr:hypothetical protein LEP1GSC179_2675 [Leptospira santarosai str. MOR084]EKO79683.1 hypothetical protein LEP1GSC068_3184 [Leptospira sp. Fiocruz LV3954]EKR89556.1 hypothetical protein LEP1GSC163_2549 [Leptospira santarosai str. CBC379]EMI68772.1 hypothetical protein LEP1GSC076_2383 [Leptospira sp. Fiocruz LV4135]EMM87924.1 hypothetical protein LEP1GSC039_2614 [Leptospira santarosai str. 2000027870]OLY59753.1 hypothetical protein BV917_14475 [Leptospira santarosai serovar Guaricura]